MFRRKRVSYVSHDSQNVLNQASFPEYESVESDMLTQLALDLKDRNLSDGMLVKLVLINISAQHYSLLRAPSKASEDDAAYQNSG